MTKAVGLFSGGLDSVLALALIRDQGIRVQALHFYTTFASPGRKGGVDRAEEVRRRAANLGINLTLMDATEDFLEMIRHPRFGYGSGVNPCLDCRVISLRKAKVVMEAVGAHFVFTGEVLGQRPMSQRRDTLRVVERESGLEGRLLRPLSARLLPPSVPEQKGWVDRARLLDLSGRSRRPQIALAREYGITDYPQPAGGCFLTDKILARRILDLLPRRRERALSREDLILSRIGRHFRLSDVAKVIVGRWEAENDFLEGYAQDRWVFQVVAIPGPVALALGTLSPAEISQAASLVARYGDAKMEPLVQVRYSRNEEAHLIVVPPATDAESAAWRI
ncbi:MAG: thiamine biosynthesis protein [Candidatus Latescibacterota bacterium]